MLVEIDLLVRVRMSGPVRCHQHLASPCHQQAIGGPSHSRRIQPTIRALPGRKRRARARRADRVRGADPHGHAVKALRRTRRPKRLRNFCVLTQLGKSPLTSATGSTKSARKAVAGEKRSPRLGSATGLESRRPKSKAVPNNRPSPITAQVKFARRGELCPRGRPQPRKRPKPDVHTNCGRNRAHPKPKPRREKMFGEGRAAPARPQRQGADHGRSPAR